MPSRLLGRALLHRQRRLYRYCGAVARFSRVGSAWARGIGDIVGRNFRVAVPIFSRASSNLSLACSDDSAKTISSSLHPLPLQYLQYSDAKLFDPLTHQRNDVHFDIIDGRPTQRTAPHINHEERKMPSEMPDDWIRSQAERWRAKADDFDDHSLLDVKSASIATTPESMAKGIEAKPRFATTKNAKRILWSNWTEDMIRDPQKSPILFCFDDLIGGKGNADNSNSSNDCEERRLLQALYQYGLVLIRGTPTYTDSLSVKDMSESSKEIRRRVKNNSNSKYGEYTSAESAILHLASIVGYHPLRTLYGGGIWSTSSYSSFYNKADDGEGNDESSSSSVASTADSSYGSSSLPLHTDMTYISNPPGVQVFLMVQPAEPAVSRTFSDDDDGNKKAAIVPKGQSVYLDGFAAARQLLHENPDAYRMLASTPRRYRCIDTDLGWHLEASGPVIETILSRGLDGCGNPLVKSIRHNDLDRLPDLPPYPSANDATVNVAEYSSFYRSLREAHEAWDDILRRDSMRFVIDLQAGDCVLVSNQRCMHGRYAFETSRYPRVIMGCYVGMDELASKWRGTGLQVLY